MTTKIEKTTKKRAMLTLRLPASLHEALKRQAEEEGTTLNQYCLYLLAQAVKR